MSLNTWMDRYGVPLFRRVALRSVGADSPSTWTQMERMGGYWLQMVMLESQVGEAKVKGKGFAMDKSRRVVCIKALMEALEQLAYIDAGLTLQSRNGIAADYSREAAVDTAYLELIERDALVFHWVGEVPFLAVSDDVERQVPKWIRGIEELEKQIHVRKLHSADPSIHVFLATLYSDTYRCWQVGMAAHRAEREAAYKAVRELAGQAFAHRIEKICPGELESKKRKLLDVDIQHLLTRDESVSRLMRHLLSPAQDLSWIKLDPDQVRRALACTDLPTLNNKYSVVRGENSLLMPIRFGKTFEKAAPEYLRNPRLIQLFSGKRPDWRFHAAEDLIPHPLA